MDINLEYLPIENVFNFISPEIREDYGKDAQMLSNALQALRQLNIPDMTCTGVTCLEVIDHKVCLPQNIKTIEDIRLVNRQPEQFHIESTNADGEIENGLYAQLFLQSAFYNECTTPLNFKGNTKSNYITSSCYQRFKSSSDIGFSITDRCLTVDVASGWLCVVYNEELKTDDGKFLIPKFPSQIWMGMGKYVEAQYWLRRSIKEPSLRKFYRDDLALANMYLYKANGIFKQRAISFKTLAAIQNIEVDWIRLNATWSNKLNRDG